MESAKKKTQISERAIDQSLSDFIQSELNESAEVKLNVASALSQVLADVTSLIIESLRNGGKVLLCGNGGSAADAQHLATELVSRLEMDRPAISAIALTTNTSLITAHSNDFGFDSIFSRQLEALGKPGDVLIGISTSGNSENVLRAIRTASSMNIMTVAFSGREGGLITKLADYSLVVPSHNTQRIQEAHIAMGHCMCALIERAFFANTGAHYA